MSTKPHRLFPHGEFRQLAPNLWIVRGGLSFPLYRNMVVYRLPDGRLVLQSRRTQRSEDEAARWSAGGSRNVTVLNWALNLSAEYKGASGTKLGQSGSSTFDQLSPANHDKFGHQDLFGWRNLKTLKSLETLSLTKSFALNLMYTNDWLFSACDSLFNSSGGSIAIAKNGVAGTHVGQELDSFVTYTHRAEPKSYGSSIDAPK